MQFPRSGISDDVFPVAYDLKIRQPIVRLVAVEMVDLESIWDLANEHLEHESMDVRVKPDVLAVHPDVPISCVVLLSTSRSRGSRSEDEAGVADEHPALRFRDLDELDAANRLPEFTRVEVPRLFLLNHCVIPFIVCGRIISYTRRRCQEAEFGEKRRSLGTQLQIDFTDVRDALPVKSRRDPVVRQDVSHRPSRGRKEPCGVTERRGTRLPGHREHMLREPRHVVYPDGRTSLHMPVTVPPERMLHRGLPRVRES